MMIKSYRPGASQCPDFAIIPVCRRLLDIPCVAQCTGTYLSCPRGNLKTLRMAYGETIRDFILKLGDHGLKIGNKSDMLVLVTTYNTVEGRNFIMRGGGKPFKLDSKLAQIMCAMHTWAKSDPEFASKLTGDVDDE